MRSWSCFDPHLGARSDEPVGQSWLFVEVERVYADVDFIESSFYLLTYRSVLLDDLN